MFLEPATALLMGVEIIEDDVHLAVRKGGNHTIHEAEKLETTAALSNQPPNGPNFRFLDQSLLENSMTVRSR